ncbi:hypothetical protein GR927_28265 [Mycolicibacterium sp. 3033]|nr:hypothetical protein [Mycolicibacterium aurantiacum]
MSESHVRLRDLVPGFDDIGEWLIPYARLPRRLSDYANEFVRWADIADQTPHALLQRPRVGVAAVDALVQAAHDTVHAHAQAAIARQDSAEQAVTAVLGRLTDFDRALLEGRRWCYPPVLTATLAEELGVAGATLSRNLPRAERRLAELLNDPLHSAVCDYATRLAKQLGPLLPDDLVEATLRGLRIDPAGQTAQFLLYVAGPYRPDGHGWTENVGAGGRPWIQTVVDRVFARSPAPTMDALRDELARAGMTDEAAWAFLRSQQSLRRFGEVCVRWNPDSTADMAEAVLHALAEPMTANAIHAAIGADTASFHTVEDVLRNHRRFVRASRRTWALDVWGREEYTTIADAIATSIDRLGGQAAGPDIVSDVLARFPDVAEGSVWSYLRTLAFINTKGSYRRRSEDDTFREVTPLDRIRGAFRNGDDEVRYALTVDAEVLRGSAKRLPPAVAHAAGVQPGQRKTFTNPVGDITVLWKLSSVRGTILSSLRAHALAARADEGDTLVLAFDFEQISITHIPADVVGLSRLKALLGRRVRNPVTALATSLECRPNQVAAVLRARGDDDLADLCSELTDTPAAAAPT